MLFQSKKLICAGMNLVTSLQMSKAVFDAGGIPSMLYANMGDQAPATLAALKQYANGKDYIICIRTKSDLKDTDVQNLLNSAPTHIELLEYPYQPYHIEAINTLRTAGIKVIQKTPDYNGIADPSLFDGVTIKLSGGSGLSPIAQVSLTDIAQFLSDNSHLGVIFSGGLYDNTEIDPLKTQFPDAYYSMGARFLISTEATLDPEVITKILNSKNKRIELVTGVNSCRNLINFFETYIPEGIGNNTQLLELGLYSPISDQGICYMGNVIDKITTTQSISDIINSITV